MSEGREQERNALAHEIALLEEMAVAAGESPEISAAVHERRQRIEHLEEGEAPRPLSPVSAGGAASGAASTGTARLSSEQLQEIFSFYCNFGRSAVMSYQESMDSFMFMKFARECPGLLDSALTTTEVDLVFIKAKPKFERRLDFEHFLDALAAVAERKFPGMSPRDGLRQLISQHLAPHYDMVQIEMGKTGESEIPLSGVFKKLYDPRSYTGVYAERFRTGDGRINGESDHRPGRSYKGSTNTGTDEIIHDVSSLMRPNLHGAGTMISPSNHMLYRKQGLAGGPGGPATPGSAGRPGRAVSPTLSRSYSGGAAAMSSAASTASSAASPRFTAGPDAHHIASSPVPGAGALPFAGDDAAQAAALRSALARAQAGDPSDLMALTMALTEQVKRMQGGAGAAGSSSASAGSSSFRGAASVAAPPSAGRSGGSRAASRGRGFAEPEYEEEAAAGRAASSSAASAASASASAALRAEVEELESDIAQLREQLDSATAEAHRSGGPTADDAAYIREVTEAIRTRRSRIQDLISGASRPLAVVGSPTPRGASSPRTGFGGSGALGGGGMGGGASVVSSSAPAINQDQLREVFEFYCNFGRSAIMTYQDSMDSFMFMKFARECPDLMDRRLNATEVDLIFTKAKPKFERRLLFTHFLDALSAMAERKFPEAQPVEGLRHLLANHMAPHYDMVQIEMGKTGESEIPLSGVFKKLYDPRSYTGVYAERFRTGDGRINGETDNRPGRSFNGNTNTGTDEIIHDISVLMRPHLRSGTMMRSRPVTAGGSPRRLARSMSPRSARSPSVDGRSVISRR